MKLEKWEREAIDFLLSGRRHELRNLRLQASTAFVSRRRTTPEGLFVYLQVPDRVERIESSRGLVMICDVMGELGESNISLDLTLTINAGQIRKLSVYAFADSQPEQIDNLRLFYLKESPAGSGLLYKSESRDWKYFEKNWEITKAANYSGRREPAI
jgi:hypothetical protein